jgi:hypothetical protein
MPSASVHMSLPAGYSPSVLDACELNTLTAGLRLYCCVHDLLARTQDLLLADPLPPNSKLVAGSKLTPL